MNNPKKSYLLKHIMDKVLALSLLIILSPLLIAIVACIKLEGIFFSQAQGPVLVSEPRLSQGKVFKFFKFRKVKKEVLESIRRRKPGTYSFSEFQHKPANLTHMGKILKKFYLDEFPQLFNVLKGDISFVGPRAYTPKLYREELERGAVYRKIMRAGLTGLVAVNKGSNKNGDALDAEYFRKYSTFSSLKLLVYDASIFLKTIELVFKAKGY